MNSRWEDAATRLKRMACSSTPCHYSSGTLGMATFGTSNLRPLVAGMINSSPSPAPHLVRGPGSADRT